MATCEDLGSTELEKKTQLYFIVNTIFERHYTYQTKQYVSMMCT